MHPSSGLARAYTLSRRGLAALGAAALGAALFIVTPTAAAGTGTIAVCLTSSEGANLTLGGDQAWYQVGNGSTNYVGAVGDSGCREQTVPADTNVTVWVARHGSYSQKVTTQVAADGTKVVDLYTTKVTVHYPGSVAFGGSAGNSDWFDKPSEELLPFRSTSQDPHVFRLSTGQGYARTELTWPIANGTGQARVYTFHAIRVISNDGSPIEGIGASKLTSPGYHVSDIANPDTTDASGFLAWARSGLVTSTDITVRVNGTRGVESWDPSSKPLQVFQTTKVTLKYWPGLTSRARYFFNDVNAAWFDSPSKEMFAGEYVFQFRSTGTPSNPGTMYTQTTIDVPPPADGPITRTAVVVRLQDSEGNGLKGSVSYYKGGWSNDVVDTEHTVPNAVDGGNVATQPQYPGSAVVVFNGSPTNVTFAIANKGARQQLAKQDVQEDSTAYFHTVKVTVKLRDAANDPLEDGAVRYYTNKWRDMDDTDANGNSSIELLPSKVSFAVTWKGSRQQKTVNNVGDDPTVTFKTVPVTVELRDAANDPLEGGSVSFYTNSWRDMSDTDANGNSSIELLPSKVSFAVTWKGSRQQKTVDNVGDDPTVTFKTVPVTVQLADHLGGPLEGGSVSFYTNSWRDMSDTDTDGDSSIELLPSKVSFAVTWQGSRQQKTVGNISDSGASPVLFQTSLFVDDPEDAVVPTSYYTNSWRSFPEGGVELLPSKVTFKYTGNPQSTISGFDPGVVISVPMFDIVP